MMAICRSRAAARAAWVVAAQTGWLHSDGQQLASSVRSPLRPTTVLVHGLDSSKQTWTGVLSKLSRDGYPALALDLRGMGESALGPVAEFGPKRLAADLLDALEAAGVTGKVVLVGHSMGARVAMRLAADSPDRLAGLVIEDMDARPRPVPSRLQLLPSAEGFRLPGRLQLELGRFADRSGRVFKDYDEVHRVLGQWYARERVAGWRGGRVRELPGGGWWSDINPLAMSLAYNTVLGSTDGWVAWQQLARAGPGLPVLVWVADAEHTVCAEQGEGGLADMRRCMPGCELRVWEGAGHSVHNSSTEQFVAAIEQLVDRVSPNLGEHEDFYD